VPHTSYLTIFSFNVNAAIISVDWKTAGDGLITRDTVSGLDWLDLTETNGLTYEYVSGQLGAGGQFDGYRYATNSEAVALWANFGIDLNTGATTYIPGYVDPAIENAAMFMGNIFNEYNADDRFGVYGLTGETLRTGIYYTLGAWESVWEGVTYTYYSPIGAREAPSYTSAIYQGSYLVKPDVIPVPAAVWLFGSGLVGLIGVARRKTRS
jgi:hypothetical protein